MRNPFSLRAKWYRSIHMASAWYALAIMDDDELTWKDAPETVAFGAGLAWVWWDVAAMAVTVNTTPLVALEAAIVTGAVASFAIGGVEGVETYADYISKPHKIHKDPEKVEALIQASDITLSLANPLHIPQKKLAEWIVEDLPWGEVFKNRWLTGPYRPF